MGMAASQARFLTLTARKSNVEYEGQQVNQQRTSLSNESAGLFNKMMALQVPTPPSATDFYNTRYTFNAKGADYSITEFTPRTDGTYDLTIVYAVNAPTARSYSAHGSVALDSANVPVAFTPIGGDAQSITKYILDETNKKYYSLDSKGDKNYDDDASIKTVVDVSKDESAVYYGYKNQNVKYFVSSVNMEEFLKLSKEDPTTPLSAYYATTKIDNKKTSAVGTFPETTEEGRFEKLVISDVDDPTIKDALTGTQFDLSLTQVQDDEGYAEAMKDYEYQKMLYERTINDINAQTEIIQQQDRTLELRLKQLDTEQNALNTELEAVKKVIEQNVEATFKTFA